MSKIVIVLPDRKDLDELLQKPLAAAAVMAVSVIQRRTAKGIDANGQAFRQYSKAYAEKKRESGRRSTTPDLTLTGQMVRGLKVLTPTNAAPPASTRAPRQVLIGIEGQHRDTRFARNEKKWDTVISSSRDTRTRTQRDGRTVTYRQTVDKYRRNAKKGRGYTLQRLASTTPMATIARANHRLRPWLAVRTPDEIAKIVRVFKRVFDEELRRRNEEAQRESQRALTA